MKKLIPALLILVCASAVLFAQTSRPRKADPPIVPSTSGEEVVEDEEMLTVDTTLVTIPVSVFDRSGRFISGLRKQDFQIYEDGKAQQIDTFATTEQPFTVVLLLDVSRSTQFKIEEIQEAAISFVEQMRPQDKLMVVAFDDEIQILSEATNDKRQLRNAIYRTRLGGGTKLYDAVDFALNERLNSVEGRKAIVLFTDGIDSSSEQSDYASTIADAERSDVIVYPIKYDTSEFNGGGSTQQNRWPNPFPRRGGGNNRRGGGNNRGGIQLPFPWPGGGGNGGGGGGGNWPGSGGSQEDEQARGARYLQALSNGTGGKYFNADSTGNLDSAFAGIAEEMRQQYSLGYYPEISGRAGQRKQISVRVARPNVSVKAKGSYIVGEQERNANKVPFNRLARSN